MLLYALDIDTEGIKKSMKRGDEYKGNIQLPDNVLDSESGKRAEEAFRKFNSPERQARIRSESERLKDKLTGNLPEETATASTSALLSSSERVYVFVSSSMQINTIRAYADDIDRIGDPNVVMVMRGFVGGMKFIKPTMEFIARVIKKDSSCDSDKVACDSLRTSIIVDPLIYRRYGIDRVPAVVFVPRIEVKDSEGSEGLDRNADVSVFHVVYGDASLEYLLGRIRKEAKSPSLSGLLAKLKGNS